MKLQEFIRLTRQLINKQVFKGNSSKLQDSITIFCNALEKNEQINAPLCVQLSDDLEAGSQSMPSSSPMTLIDAWKFIYNNVLKNDLDHTTSLRERLDAEFEDDMYTDGFQVIWRAVVPVPAEAEMRIDLWGELDLFIEDLPQNSKGHILSPGVLKHYNNLQNGSVQRKGRMQGLDYNFLFTAGQVLFATTCVVSFSVAALAVMSIITLSTTQLGAAVILGGFSAACGLTFFTDSVDRPEDNKSTELDSKMTI